MSAKRIEVPAPAKINLYLEVLNKRRDGYHNLESVMQTVSLYDRIVIEARPKALSLVCSRKDLPTDKRNLAMRAAILLKEETGVKKGARIILEKNIPLGAGLGGGSSDAAAVLKGLCALWDLKLPEKTLISLAGKLGADVPFFMKGGMAVARGIGERLTPLIPVRKIKKAHFILIYPGFPVSTPWVYQNLRFPLTFKQKISNIKKLLEGGSPPSVWGKHLFNRLEEVVFPQYPMIEHTRKALEREGCFSLMSGSGSTVFGLVSTKKAGERVLSRLKRATGSVWLVEAIN